MEKLNVLAISGSLRRDSYNRKALQIAKRMAAETGAVVTEFDLKENSLPVYDGDIEAQGLPESAQKLKQAVEAADVILIASPEYNHSVSSALKNAIDWASRKGNSWDGKFAAIFGVSSGRFGTVHGQIHLRRILQEVNVLVLPKPEVFIGGGGEAFDPDGSLRDPKTMEMLTKLIQRTLEVAQKLKN